MKNIVTNNKLVQEFLEKQNIDALNIKDISPAVRDAIELNLDIVDIMKVKLGGYAALDSITKTPRHICNIYEKISKQFEVKKYVIDYSKNIDCDLKYDPRTDSFLNKDHVSDNDYNPLDVLFNNDETICDSVNNAFEDLRRDITKKAYARRARQALKNKRKGK